LATPNYGYEKRQKELAKKQKKAEKLKEKSERRAHGPMDDTASSELPDSDPTQGPSADQA